jgi:hypothetical protein
MGIKLDGQPQLSGVAHAGNPLRLLLVPDQNREQHGRQDSNNGNHHQQLNQRERGPDRAKTTTNTQDNQVWGMSSGRWTSHNVQLMQPYYSRNQHRLLGLLWRNSPP